MEGHALCSSGYSSSGESTVESEHSAENQIRTSHASKQAETAELYV